MAKRSKSKSTRRDWERNNVAVRDALAVLFKELKRMPTTEEVAKRCGLTRQAVQRHLKAIEVKGKDSPARALVNDVIMGLAIAAMNGKSGAARLYFAICFDKKYGGLQGEGNKGGSGSDSDIPEAVIYIPDNGRDS